MDNGWCIVRLFEFLENGNFDVLVLEKKGELHHQ